MYSQIKITGQVLKVVQKEYEGQVSYQLQFMINDIKKGFEVINVKVDKEFFNPEIKDNIIVEVPIRMVPVQNNLYFSCIDKIQIRK